jgi:Tol biopolymer transport system component
MTPERHRQIGALYRRALELRSEQRSVFLSDACRGDETLQREVESLLCYEARAHATIDGSAIGAVGRALAVEQAESWVGRQISHYRVLSILGGGGMGLVYRARDSRLDREVAIKALPLIYSRDATRLRWFEQEARAAGRLNHPNVLTVFDVGIHDGAPFIVAELLAGEDLRQALSGRALPCQRVHDYAKQIARGLSATHAKGIIHRDLKPENLFVTQDGHVKILDFGLAKLTAHPVSAAPIGERLETSPGVLLGTIDYLSPEQLRGGTVDHRADLFAFGVVVYEMLTGRRPFQRESPAEIITAILTEPAGAGERTDLIDPTLWKIISRCLEKSPDQRFQSASDLWFALDALPITSEVSSDARTFPTRRARAAARERRIRWSAALVLLLSLSVAAAVGTVWHGRSAAPHGNGPVARVLLPGQILAPAPEDLAVSPDGVYVAYSVGRRGAKTLYLRNLAEPRAAVVTEIDDATAPFFSPDSQWLGFFTGGKLKTMSVHGGTPATLTDSPSNRGAHWGMNGSIVFAPIARSGLFRMPATGGAPEVLTLPDSERLETSHVQPSWLPGGDAVLYVARGETQGQRSVVALSLKDRRRKVLIDDADAPRYVSTGHLLYIQQRTLMAAPFDVDRLELLDTPAPVVDDVASYAVSDAGLLVYASASAVPAPSTSLVWVDRRDGEEEPIGAPPRNYYQARLSPDGRRLALVVESGPDTNVWIYDLMRNALSRLTFQGRNGWPVWSHDGRYVIYGSNRAGTSWDVYRKAADGTGEEEVLLDWPLLQLPYSLSGDGRILGLTEADPASFQVSLVSMGMDAPIVTVANAWSPSLSPDGSWVAYTSSVQTGRYEIYVRPTSGASDTWQVSADGGVEPLWSADGSELFYRRRDDVLAVDVGMRGGFEYGSPHVLFRGRYALDDQDSPRRTYDVTPDGQRFLMIKEESAPAEKPLNIVVNWFTELQNLRPVRK